MRRERTANPWLLECVWLAVTLTIATTVQAEDWPHWRGPNFNGSTSETGLPANWSRTENIAWSVALPGTAAATPIVSGEYVFLSGVDEARNTLQAQGYDRRTGRLLWSRDVAQGIRRDSGSNYASASPVTDDQVVVYFYGNGDLACFGLNGTPLWARNLQRDFGPWAFFWTFGGSPLLYGGRLYVQILQRDVAVEGRGWTDRPNESYLLALAPGTGQTLWRQVRASAAVAEARESHASPIPWRSNGQGQLLVAGGDALSGHDLVTGRELWRWGEWNPQRAPNWPLIASPVANSRVVLVCIPKREPAYAIQLLGASASPQPALAWSSRPTREVTSEVPTPAYYDGDFFVLSDSRNCLSRVSAATGQVKWSVPTPGRDKYEASPLAADGKVYLINFAGQVAIINASDGALLRTIAMDEPAAGNVVRASIVAAHGQLFIRTTRHLYCVGRKP